jgi:hypothetical protein
MRQPALARARRAPWPTDLPPAAAQPGLRALLLLRMAAGLDEADAAAVLGVAEGTARRGLERVVPRLGDGAPDTAAWSRQAQALQQRVRDLPTDRTLRLARGREAALAGTAEQYAPARRWRPAAPILAVAAAVAVALGATWWMERRADDRVETAELGPAGRPASRFSPTGGLIAHPDFALLADPAGEALARDVAFLSWSAAQVDAATAPADPLAPTPPAAVEALAPYVETADAP